MALKKEDTKQLELQENKSYNLLVFDLFGVIVNLICRRFKLSRRRDGRLCSMRLKWGREGLSTRCNLNYKEIKKR